MISIEIQEWQEMKAKVSQLQQEVFFLRKQNKRLKKIVDVQNQEENYSQSSGNMSIDGDVKGMYGMTDLINEQDDNNEQPIHFVHARSQGYHSVQRQNKWQCDIFYSDKENVQKQCENKENLYPDDTDEIRVSRKSQQSVELKKLISASSSEKSSKEELSLIQEICLFGPSLSEQNLSSITFKNDEKQLVEPELYYPYGPSVYQDYGSYLFPKKVRVKPTQKANIPMQCNKTIFKSSKKQDPNIYIFQGNEQLHPIKQSHKLLQSVNPSKWLYGIVIEFNDFVFQEVNSPRESQKYMKKTSLEGFSPLLKKKSRGSLLQLDLQQFMEQQIHLETVSLKDIELEKEKTRMFRSTFSLCIFTYFPFITYMQGIIAAIFDQVKLKRIENFPLSGQFKDSDILYFVNELGNVAKKIKHYFGSKPVRMGKELSLKIGDTLLHIDLSQEHLYKQLYGNWAYKLIKSMDRDTFYQIYCMIMIEESVSFVCENQRTLTFMILLFSSMLTKPFVYPYPVVSVLFTEELLQTPFTSIVGINHSEEWLEDAIDSGVIDSQNKQFVIITEKEVKVRRTQNYNFPKSEALRKIFTRFYKRTEPSSLTDILLGREIVMFNESPKETDEFVIDFFVKLHIFYHENIFMFMPSNMKLVKEEEPNGEEVNKVVVRNKFLDKVEKEYKKAHPDYWKDEFIKEFVKTQIFSIYLMNEYQLNQ